MSTRVLVVGGGLGGLCLAQRLRGAVETVVLERDASPVARTQGYRITLKRAGVGALRACLPPELFELVAATSLRQATRMVFLDERLRPTFAKPIPPDPVGFGVDRATLRGVLLTGLEEAVSFGARFERYEPLRGGRVRVHAAGRPATEVDLLVGADGTGSAVRAQLLPEAGLDEPGWAIYGRTPLTDDLLGRLPPDLVDTFNRVVHPGGAALSVATCRLRTPVAEAVRQHAPHARLADVAPYLSWTLTRPGGPPAGRAPAHLHALAADTLAGWHPAVRGLVEAADPQATFRCPITSARPVAGWAEAAVTLLGDAVHTMSPGRGEGANVALRDAAVLGGLLAAGGPAADAAARYREQMLDYGFAAVEASRSHPFTPVRPA